MNGVAIRGRRRLRALILGLLATGLLYLPPVSIAARADRGWSALLSALAPPSPANDILLLRIDDPRWATTLARIARREHAKLLITTWNAAQPETARAAADPVPAGARAPASIREVTRQQILANPAQVAGKVLIAGPAAAASAPALDPAVMAQALAGDAPDADSTPALARAAGWLGAALWLGWWLWKMPRRTARRIVVAASGPAALLSLSAAGWLAAAWSVPVAGPSAWLLLTAGLYNLNRRSAVGRRRQAVPAAAAVRLAEAGRLEEAWRWYRNQAVSAALLEPLYAIAAAFEKHGRRDLAADVFYAIAQADVHYRDVPRRLLTACRAEAETPIMHPPASPFGSLPATLGRYELLEEIGHGSAAHVFLAHDSKINRIVALKVIDLSARFEEEERKEAHTRFLREAETAGRLNHRGIITVFDAGEADGRAYIAMEYSKGRRLSDFTAPDRRLPPLLVLELIAQTAEALHYAHQQNVVHRDIKPANIMYDSVWDSVKIADFGIARLIDVSRTRTGVVLGTPSYMAPEQLEGENVNGHTDLFALGVSLYQLLTGQLPFQGNSMTKLMFVIANEPHPPATAVDPELAPELNPLVDAALAKNPGDRFASGAEMADALRAVAARIG
jgi:serine/threonine-protein kinase